jgi:hypothetical protein
LTGSTVIQDTGYTQTGGMGVNVHVEYNPDGTWTISWLPGGALTPAQAEDVASYPNSITTPVDTTYSGAGYKYAGWAFAHATAENAQFDNFGAYAAFPAPVATAATAVTANSFTANWDAVPGAADYRLDVSESPVFSSFLPGYQNLTVAGTSQSVSVANGGVYYYRVRARAGNKFSANSNVIDVTISTVLSVNLKRSDGFTDYNFWEISGIRSPAQEIVMDGSSCVLVVNDGTVAQDISLSATASTWNLGATSGLDQCVLMGLFNGNTVPAAGDFSTAHDLISGVETWSSVSAGAGAFEGLSNGTNVASGTNRKLYLYLRTPSSVSSGAQQAITVTVGCRAH